MPSTLDFNGIYQGKYIEFDAKETNNKTSFPLSNVHPHQIKHIRNMTVIRLFCLQILKMVKNIRSILFRFEVSNFIMYLLQK